MSSNRQMNSVPATGRSTQLPNWLRMLRKVGSTIVWIALALVTLWAVAALFVDCRIAALRIPLALLYVLGVIIVFVKLRRSRSAAVAYLAGFCCVLAWWLTLKPSNDGNWQSDVDRIAWAEIEGDRVTLHNLRNCNYRTEIDYSDCWKDEILDLAQIQGVDVFVNKWGLSFASHPIVSFQFGDNGHIAFSIEARYKKGQAYSTILGCFRQFGLIFVAADERDPIRLRTNYRKGEDVYIYRLRETPEVARGMFLTYIANLNRLKDHPEWYNEVTRNCTTTIDKQLADAANRKRRWSYRLLLNGTLDQLLYDRGRLVTGGLPFPELEQRQHINAAARAANGSPDFSALIRAGRVGFEQRTEIEKQ